LSFMAPENVYFRCRLEGFDNDWVDTRAARAASYPHLAPGAYRFMIMACNSAGNWNEGDVVLALAVRPFFWQTWWFRGVALCSFTGSIIAIVRLASFRRLRQRLRQTEQQAAVERERTRIA